VSDPGAVFGETRILNPLRMAHCGGKTGEFSVVEGGYQDVAVVYRIDSIGRGTRVIVAGTAQFLTAVKPRGKGVQQCCNLGVEQRYVNMLAFPAGVAVVQCCQYPDRRIQAGTYISDRYADTHRPGTGLAVAVAGNGH